ncbi:hypothetical protein C0580_04195 [Candidatus Parcubacteria bacterium]|nr:MAG: hypothetical protein C0580_04195 [Candidatus Parcubacteria bacterium]
MFKRFILISSLFLLATLSVGCSKNSNQESLGGNLKIAATIFPLYDLTRQIGGEKVDVKLVTEPGASPHTFEATPSLVKDLEGVKVIFSIGHLVDNWAADLVLDKNKIELFVVDQGIDLKEFNEEDENNKHEAEEEDGENHEHSDVDPHYWLAPDNAVQIATNIYKKLSEEDPENKDYYKNNLDDFVQRIEYKNIEWQNKVDDIENKEIVVFHDAWGYFADYFGFNIVASFEPFPGKEPTPSYLIDLQADINEHNIKAIFVEPQLSKSSLETLAKDLGVKIGVMDPLGGVSGRQTYVELIDYNINTLSEVLY